MISFKRIIALLFLILTAPSLLQAHTIRVSDLSAVPLTDFISDLKTARIIFVGERHDNAGHHRAQLQIIKALYETGSQLVVGLEMFRSDNQEVLDKWVSGEIELETFLKEYKKNWDDWPSYEKIFLYAREKQIPMLGLNISRTIVKQVARQGFKSLSQEDLTQLPKISCVVNDAYEAFIRKAIGTHAVAPATFTNFCEAQLLWDKVMARNLNNFLTQNTKTTVVVLAGKGHSWKSGIPAHIIDKEKNPFRVLLPVFSGQFGIEFLTTEDADYLLMGTEEGPLH